MTFRTAIGTYSKYAIAFKRSEDFPGGVQSWLRRDVSPPYPSSSSPFSFFSSSSLSSSSSTTTTTAKLPPLPAPRPAPLNPHLPRIPTMFLKELPEPAIFRRDSVLIDAWQQQQQREPRAEEYTAPSSGTRATAPHHHPPPGARLDDRKNVRAHERADLAHRGRRARSTGRGRPSRSSWPATRPILAPGPTSPRARKMPEMTTQPPHVLGYAEHRVQACHQEADEPPAPTRIRPGRRAGPLSARPCSRRRRRSRLGIRR